MVVSARKLRLTLTCAIWWWRGGEASFDSILYWSTEKESWIAMSNVESSVLGSSVDKDVDETVVRVDFLVVGGGMAGMTGAAYAASHGAKVIVVEAGSEIGGSAMLSGLSFWTVDSVDTLLQENPGARSDLGDVLIEGYPAARAWLEECDLTTGDRYSTFPLYGFPGQGIRIDIVKAMARWRSMITERGGWIALSSRVANLVQDAAGTVIGAEVEDRDGLTKILAPHCLLATGGFQGSSELRREHIGHGAERILLRSNPQSDGQGLRLGLSVGASTSSDMSGFYGHLVPFPLRGPFLARDFIRLAQISSTHAVLLDESGHRFIDESRGYFWNAQAVTQLASGRALLVADERVRRGDSAGYRPGHEQIDRTTEASQAGGNVCEADSLKELDAVVAEWGYPPVSGAVSEFNESILHTDQRLTPGRARFRKPLDTCPYFAMEVQPAITFTEGGLDVDVDARVLDETKRPIPGLLAAGADVGGLFRGGYGGGLAMATTFGIRAAKTALARMDGRDSIR
jgi:succinate dehydrogenase/fumarate reductase flavoprotein subunit